MKKPITFDIAPTLRSMSHSDSHANGGGQIAIALADTSSRDKNQNGAGWKDDGTMYTLDTTGLQGVAQSMQVRRLTPRECERLQGFPDDYTLIPYRNKPAADGPRYKALGNSMAVPVMAWIGKRIDKFSKEFE